MPRSKEIEYIYLPNYETTEHIPIFIWEEFCDLLEGDAFRVKDVVGAKRATEVIYVSDRAGHYATADWTEIAIHHIENEIDGWSAGNSETRQQLKVLCREGDQAIIKYRDTGGENLDEMVAIASEIESVLDDQGYITEWNNGVTTWKIHEKDKEEDEGGK